MATVTVTQKNFNSGEITPALWSAYDLDKYQNGMKVAQNAVITKTREVMNRQGLEYIAEVYNQDSEIRLLPFKFNTDQTYVIEAGHKYFRIIQNGKLITSETSWYSDSFTYTEKWQLRGDNYRYFVLSDVNIDSGRFYDLPNPLYEKFGEGAGYYRDAEFTQEFNFPENAIIDERRYYVDKTLGMFGERYYKISVLIRNQREEVQLCVITPYSSDDVSTLKYSQVGDVVTICSKNFKIAPMELKRTSSWKWEIDDVVISASVSAPQELQGVWTGGSESPRTYQYKVTAVDSDGEESVGSDSCAVVGEYEASWGVNEKITLTWQAVTGAKEYNIYKCVNGVFGFCGRSETNQFVDDKIEPDLSSTPPIQKNLYDESGYPSVVTNYQQRCVLANFEKYPQRFVASQVGNPHNFNVSRPVNASDAITVDLSEKEVNEIRHLVAVDDLIALTSGAEWVIKGSDGSFSANPTPVCTPQSYHGSSDIQPIVSGNFVLFVTDTCDCVRDLGYSITSDGYDGDELSVFATHLFEDDKIKEWAYQKSENMVWCVLESGGLVSMLYDKKQGICGWTRHKTEGVFLSVTSARENGYDVLYFVVARLINGKPKKFIERMGKRQFSQTSDCFFVDCGVRKFFNEGVTTITGLSHLEGEKVVALADGGVVENLIVKDGKITLPSPATNVVVGLPYTFRLETLPIETDGTVGKLKKITKTDIRIRKSREDFSVQNGNEKKLQPRSYESINNADFLKSGTVSANLFSVGKTETEFVIEQSLPLPICISSITQTVTVETDD